MAELRLRQVRSAIGSTQRQRATLRALGLNQIGATSRRPDNEAVRGMVAAVRHLLAIDPVTVDRQSQD